MESDRIEKPNCPRCGCNPDRMRGGLMGWHDSRCSCDCHSARSRHTPGPWRVDPNWPSDIQCCADGKDVATCGEILNRRMPPEERRANALLVAAAPDLRAALERYVHEDPSDLRGAPETETYKQAIAALSAAGGLA